MRESTKAQVPADKKSVQDAEVLWWLIICHSFFGLETENKKHLDAQENKPVWEMKYIVHWLCQTYNHFISLLSEYDFKVKNQMTEMVQPRKGALQREGKTFSIASL